MKIDIKGVIVSNSEKWIYDWFGMEATSPKDVSDQINKANGEEIEIEINSGGGDVFSGSEIYTTIKSYQGNSIAKIVGVAASAAGVAAMGAKKLVISPTAQLMIHNVSIHGASGDYRDMERNAEMLKNYNVSIANSYRLKTDMSQEDLIELMNKETWLNAQRAVELKFADEIMFDEGKKLVASVGGMLPPEVVNKIRNEIKAKENKQLINMAQAKLNLLKLQGGI